jgi:hypothetical protein
MSAFSINIMFSTTWQQWLVKLRNGRPNYNVDSVTDSVDLPPSRVQCLTHVRDEALQIMDYLSLHDPPSWTQVRNQFDYALDCASDDVHDESFASTQRTAFLKLWTIHALHDYQQYYKSIAAPETASAHQQMDI